MLNNISNLGSRNIFETMGGVMNIAPTKISGQYKVVCDVNSVLWLDDYTGRRVKLDKTIKFFES